MHCLGIVDWPEKLRVKKNVSELIMWILQCMYSDQHGQVITCNEHSKRFDIRAGMRQGYVLNPPFFFAQFFRVLWQLHWQSSVFFGGGLVLQQDRD